MPPNCSVETITIEWRRIGDAVGGKIDELPRPLLGGANLREFNPLGFQDLKFLVEF